MHVIKAKNVHRALVQGLEYLQKSGIERESAHGRVLMANAPVTTVYTKPTERVIFWKERDANPWFHFFEGLWMLAGRNDVAFLKQFVKRMEEYSDDGTTYHGAYGYRWRKHFDMEGGGHPSLPDQLPIIIDRLRRYPDDRRCVLTIWDPVADLGANTKDPPCNLVILFSRTSQGALDMTVCNRSNDMIWGAYGANAVHMSMLQEYVAGAVGCPVGRYWQVSNNFHAYLNVFNPLAEKMKEAGKKIVEYDPYAGLVKPYPMFSPKGDFEYEHFEEDLAVFMEEPKHYAIVGYKTKFFQRVVEPMKHANTACKVRCYDDALKILDTCWATDWQRACSQWVQRRVDKLNREKDDGVTYES